MSIIKEVKFKEDAKKPLLKGVDLIAQAVSSTMGAKGRTVLIESQGGLPIVTKDGVSVAESIFLEDPIESLGCEFVKDACRKTVNAVGDATTQTCVLINALVKESDKRLPETNGANFLKQEIELAKNKVIESLKKQAKKIKRDNVKGVATISANNDKFLGEIISDAFIKAGENGVVSFEKSDNTKTYIDFINGMPIERGWEFEGFVNVPKKRTIEFENKPVILLSYRKITNIRELLPVLEYAHKEMKELLIVSEMEYNVMQTLYANKKNGLRVGVINPPSIGEKRRDYLSDIALATNALVLDIDTSNNLESYNITDVLGTCDRLVVTKENTVLFFNEQNQSAEIASKIEELSTIIAESSNNLEKEYLNSRISKLACGVSVIKVGGNSEVEIKEKIDRVEDAIHAVKASLEDGVVVGGGVALLRASSVLKGETIGEQVMIEVCRMPFETILNNAELDPIDYYPSVFESANAFGVDVTDGQVKNMFKHGIIDPLKAIVVALENAVSVANTILTTNTTITLKRQ